MINKLPNIQVLRGPDAEGVPYPTDAYDEVCLNNPDELRRILGAQEVAGKILPCVDTRTSHWRYFLFATPGLKKTIGRRLFSVLKQTSKQRTLAGIGRLEYISFKSDGRKSKKRFINTLNTRYQSLYGTAAGVFWKPTIEKSPHYTGPPSSALCTKACDYIKAEIFEDFFRKGNQGLRHLFNGRLQKFRPGLSDLIIKKKYDLLEVAKVASKSRKLNDDDRILIFTWALLQAYYGIADIRLTDDNEDDDEKDTVEESDTYYRDLASASLGFIKCGGFKDKLNSKQINTINRRLQVAVKNKGHYQAPVLVSQHRSDGTRRRIFASLRLHAFTRLLKSTEV